MADLACKVERGYKSTRCDNFLRLKNFDIENNSFTALTKIANVIKG